MSFIAVNLKYVRNQLGFSQQELADALQIKRSLVGAYEEARATPRYDVLEQLSKLAGYTVPDLLNKILMPEGYVPPAGRGRRPGSTNQMHTKARLTNYPEAKTGAPQEPSTTDLQPVVATLTLTVDAAGNPLASLVGVAELKTYAKQYHNAAYIAALPAISIPFLQRSQPYRAFEVAPGQIHVARMVRNWGALSAQDPSHFVLVGKHAIWLATPVLVGKGLGWVSAGVGAPIADEPQEIWLSEWVITNRWAPLPDQLAQISERLATIENLLK